MTFIATFLGVLAGLIFIFVSGLLVCVAGLWVFTGYAIIPIFLYVFCRMGGVTATFLGWLIWIIGIAFVGAFFV